MTGHECLSLARTAGADRRPGSEYLELEAKWQKLGERAVVARRYEPQTALGIALRQAREQRGLTQAELGKAAGINTTWISHLESGRVNPAWGTIKRICAALDIPVSQLAAAAERFDAGPEQS
jgi:DNA-binding XRE family transcriptional regulator